MTLRAFEALQAAHTIAYPVKVRGERSTALDIVRRRVDVSGKDILELEFRMDPSDEVRQACRREAVAELAERLDRGEDIAGKVREAGITRTALTVVGWFLGDDYQLSKLYDKNFTTGYRKGVDG